MGNHGSSLDEILAEDMHHWYNKFMRESPSGLITLFELKAILNLKGMNENANSYVDQVFFTFDMDGVRKTAGASQNACDSLIDACPILGPDWTLNPELHQPAGDTRKFNCHISNLDIFTTLTFSKEKTRSPDLC